MQPVPTDKRRSSLWLSPRDLAQLVVIGVEHPAIEFEIMYGVSGNRRSFYDNTNAARFGYHPQDDSERYAKQVLAREKPSAGGPAVEAYQGGIFTADREICRTPRGGRAKRELEHELGNDEGQSLRGNTGTNDFAAPKPFSRSLRM